MMNQGSMKSYLGLHINRKKQGKLPQPFLADRIINAISGMDNARISKIPAATGVILTKDLDGKGRKIIGIIDL